MIDDEIELNSLVERWKCFCNDEWELNSVGIARIRSLLVDFSVDEIFEAMRISAGQYFVYSDDCMKINADSIQKAFDKISGILYVKKHLEVDVNAKDIYYIKGIVKNKHSTDWRFNTYEVTDMIRRAINSGVSPEYLKKISSGRGSFLNWKQNMVEVINGNKVDY